METQRKRKDDLGEALRPLLGQEIARIREDSKVSQEKLARLAGMDAGTLRRLEKGDAPLREDYLTGLCKSLDIDLGETLRRVVHLYDQSLREGRTTDQEGRLQEICHKIREKFEVRVRSERELLDAFIELTQYFDTRR
jgi:transcriptional regulator with XRE-family HTH domain